MPEPRDDLTVISQALNEQYDAIVALSGPRDVRLVNAARFLCDAIDLIDVAAQAPIRADNDNLVPA